MVKYLCTYVQDKKNHGLAFRINIQDELEQYKKKFPDRKPIVIFDFMSCLQIPVENKFDIFTCGRQPKCIEIATKFCEKFQKLGIEIIFFIDGPIKQTKIPKFLENANAKYETQKVYHNAIKNNQEIPFIFRSQKLSTYFSNFLQVVRKYGKIYISLENECDLDLAEYATRIKAMAIFTPDTDFLIFQQDWAIWNSVKFNLNKFSTIKWNKYNLRNKLKLQQRQMPIFSTLSGNDYIMYSEIEHVFEMLKGDRPQQEKLADYINENFPRGVPLNKFDFDKLAKLIYNDGKNGFSKTVAEKKIKQSLDFYDYSARKVARIESWLKTHIQYTNSVIVYMILCNFPITVHQSWINMSIPNTKSYSEIAIPVIQRQMGIVLFDQQKFNPKRTFYYKPNHDEPFQSKVFSAIYPIDIDVPLITDILHLKIPNENDSNFDDVSAIGFEDVVTLNEKFNLLSWIVSPNSDERIDPMKLIELSKSPFLIVGIILLILIQEKQISIDEADVIFLSIHEAFNSTKEKLNTISPPEKLQERPFWIAFVFNRLVDIIRNSLIICGLFKYLPMSYFDGYIFHKMYQKYLELNDEKKSTLREVILNYRIYKD